MDKKPSFSHLPAAFKELWRKAMAEVGAGKDAQATINGLGEAVSALQKMASDAEGMLSLALAANEAGGKRPSNGGPITSRKRKLSQAERSDIIKTAAKTIAAEKGDPVNIRDVAELIASKGIDLNTPVPGTMIGNVLNKSADWVRIDKGIFQHKALMK